MIMMLESVWYIVTNKSMSKYQENMVFYPNIRNLKPLRVVFD
jgi:hypothetical protein